MFVIHFSIQITISDIRCVLFRLSVWLCQVVSPNSLVNNIVIVYLFITVLNNSQINQIMYNIELVWILSECAVFCRQIKINLNFTVAPAPAPKYSSSDCIPQPAHALLKVTNILFSSCTNIHRNLLMCSSDQFSILSQ